MVEDLSDKDMRVLVRIIPDGIIKSLDVIAIDKRDMIVRYTHQYIFEFYRYINSFSNVTAFMKDSENFALSASWLASYGSPFSWLNIDRGSSASGTEVIETVDPTDVPNA
jgi:hypothetical protein